MAYFACYRVKIRRVGTGFIGSLTASWERILEVSNSCAHFLEFHRPGERRVGQSAGRFLGGALNEGGVAIAIAGRRTATGILAQLARMGHDAVSSMSNGTLVLLDSTEMLSRFVAGEVLDAQQFDSTVGSMMREARSRANSAPVRAFGDMVGVLWQRDERDAAAELESLWQRLQAEVGFALFCAYPVDVFSTSFCTEEVEGVLGAHTHVFPSTGSADLGRVLERAMDEVLGARAKDVRSRIGTGSAGSLPPMPKAEQMILWIRTHLPDVADAVLARGRELYDIETPRVYLRQEHSSG